MEWKRRGTILGHLVHDTRIVNIHEDYDVDVELPEWVHKYVDNQAELEMQIKRAWKTHLTEIHDTGDTGAYVQVHPVK